MRKILSLILGAAMVLGGGYLLYNLFFNASKIPIMFIAGGGLLVGIGGYFMFETLKEWNDS